MEPQHRSRRWRLADQFWCADEASKALALVRTRLSRFRGPRGRDNNERDLSIPAFTGFGGRAIECVRMTPVIFGVGCSSTGERLGCTCPFMTSTDSPDEEATVFGMGTETCCKGNDHRVTAGFDGSPSVCGGGPLVAVRGEGAIVDGDVAGRLGCSTVPMVGASILLPVTVPERVRLLRTPVGSEAPTTGLPGRL